MLIQALCLKRVGCGLGADVLDVNNVYTPIGARAVGADADGEVRWRGGLLAVVLPLPGSVPGVPNTGRGKLVFTVLLPRGGEAGRVDI